MQITARKPRLSTLNVKYMAAALGIVGVLAAGVTTYAITRDDSQASQTVAVAPAVTADYLEQAVVHEGAFSPAPADSASRDFPLPAHREGFQPNGPGEEFSTASPKARSFPDGPSTDGLTTYTPFGSGEGFISGTEADVTVSDGLTAYTPFGAGEGFIGGNETADVSTVAPAVIPYAVQLYLDQNGIYDITPEGAASNTGMLDEEYTQQNPGAETSAQPTSGRSAPYKGELVP